MEQTLIPDTHAFVKEMTAAGMAEPVAEAFVTNYTKHLIGNLATKQDMTTLVLEMELGVKQAVKAALFRTVCLLGGLATLLFLLDKLF